MLPVVATDAVVSRKIVTYSWVMVGTSLALWPAAGWVYRSTALIAGFWFLWMAYALRRAVDGGPASTKTAMRLFHGSITYLSLIFLAVGIDPFIR